MLIHHWFIDQLLWICLQDASNGALLSVVCRTTIRSTCHTQIRTSYVWMMCLRPFTPGASPLPNEYAFKLTRFCCLRTHARAPLSQKSSSDFIQIKLIQSELVFPKRKTSWFYCVFQNQRPLDSIVQLRIEFYKNWVGRTVTSERCVLELSTPGFRRGRFKMWLCPTFWASALSGRKTLFKTQNWPTLEMPVWGFLLGWSHVLAECLSQQAVAICRFPVALQTSVSWWHRSGGAHTLANTSCRS